ncbi:MAG: AGE family epimerase/isomerase [Woeseiaceae bacterium]|nr:AGE family epimerase/isomerase [Woeseiaceae bacterium]
MTKSNDTGRAAMKFLDRDFLRGHIRSILDFYTPRVVDPTGGYFQNFRDDGTPFDPGRRHLVSSCRIVFNYCKAYELFGDAGHLQIARHGLRYLRDRHWDEARAGYNWTLTDGHAADDRTNHCYGLAFVMLCAAAAHEAGLDGALDELERAFQIMESRLWDASNGIYADEASPDWSSIDAYRGQNANMHSCEALILAYEATGEARFLDRACSLARKFTMDLPRKSDGLVWEHYTQDLEKDWEYNKDDPKNLYRPWGFQPGHQTEWSKLLLTLHDHRPEEWMIVRAQGLFDRALEICWDKENGGIFYGFAPDGTICDSDKYFWVQAESIAASARLFRKTSDPRYAKWYAAIWQYAWDHMIDHRYGGWYRILTADNRKYSDEKSTAGGKCDYHTIGACWDVLRNSNQV